MKNCKSGYYYCNTDKKCKPIPRGYRVGYGGYLRKEKDDDDSKTKSNGNGNGNGNGSNGNGNGGNGSGGNGGGGNGGGMGEEITYEAKMTEKEKKKKEEIVMSMKKKKKDFEDRYGEDGKSVMYATATKLAMGEALNSDDKPAIKELIKKLKGSAKAHKQQSKDLEVAMKTEGSLRKWFKGSKSKDGKGGWVNVVTGGTCASDEPGEGTPKCVSSSKRASMTKAERLSAARRKKKADPGQQSKSGAAKPTYVSTDSPRKKKKMKEEIELTEVKDKKGKGSGSKDACYHKVKSRYSVWPSAYASGALVKCRKVGAANWGNSKKEEFDPSELSFQQFMEKCWKGYEKKGMKTMFGKRYPNCVKKEEVVREEPVLVPKPTATTSNASTSTLIRVLRNKKTGGVINLGNNSNKSRREVQYHDSVELEGDQFFEHHTKDGNGKVVEHDLPPRPEEEVAQDLAPSSVEEGAAWTRKAGKNKSGGLNEKGRKSYERENPGSDLKAPSKKVGNKRRASFCARMRGMKKKLTSAKTARDPDSRINKSLRAWNC